jgi:Ser/Thr protein kinase RdoA (MazF antagonist)
MRSTEVPVPEVLWQDIQGIPEAIVSKAPGHELSETYEQKSEGDVEEIVQDLGRTLSRIHEKGYDHAGKFSFEGGLILKNRCWEDILGELFGDYIHQLRGSRFDGSIMDAVKLFDNGLDIVEDHRSCLVHYDIAPDNVFCKDGEISCVIDWSRAMSGDPAFDLAYAQVQFILAFHDGERAEELSQSLFGSYDTERLEGDWRNRAWFYRKLFVIEGMKSFESWTESQNLTSAEKRESAKWQREEISKAADTVTSDCVLSEIRSSKRST